LFPKKEWHLFLCPVVFNLELGDLDVLLADASLHGATGRGHERGVRTAVYSGMVRGSMWSLSTSRLDLRRTAMTAADELLMHHSIRSSGRLGLGLAVAGYSSSS
jgi:hypothetical protein